MFETASAASTPAGLHSLPRFPLVALCAEHRVPEADAL